jgi:hypothetical protein
MGAGILPATSQARQVRADVPQTAAAWWASSSKTSEVLAGVALLTTKEIAKEFSLPSTRQLTERDIEDALCEYLESQGIPFQRQVPCEVGIADVLTDSTVYELKLSVAGSTIFTAIGQALAYRAAFGLKRAVILAVRPDRRAAMIGGLLRVPVLDRQDAMQRGLIQ